MEDNKDEEIIFGMDDEPVKDTDDTSAVEDAAAADSASAEGESKEAQEADEAEDTEGAETEEAEAAADQGEAKAEGDASSDMEKRYMSLYAEYDNYRKRTQKEKESLYSDAVADVAKEFLTVLDNIDRAVATAKGCDETSYDKVVEGIELLGRQAGDILTKIGIEEIETERGTKFDPNLHEAVLHIEDEELGEQEVAQVFSKGYSYKGKVIRHAVVQVAN